MIASGQKTIETRTWPTNYRGELLICASKSPNLPGLPSAAAVCIVELLDCRPMTRDDEAAACCDIYPGAYAWLVKVIRQVDPIHVRGSLGIFNIEFTEAPGSVLSRPLPLG